MGETMCAKKIKNNRNKRKMKRIQNLKQHKPQVASKTSVVKQGDNLGAKDAEKEAGKKQSPEAVSEDLLMEEAKEKANDKAVGIVGEAIVAEAAEKVETEEIDKPDESLDREDEEIEPEPEEEKADEEQKELDDLAVEEAENTGDSDEREEAVDEAKTWGVLAISEPVLLGDDKKDREAKPESEAKTKSKKNRREHKLFPGLWWVLGIGVVIILIILACILVPKMTNGHSEEQDVAVEDQKEEENPEDKPEEQLVEEEEKPEELSPEQPEEPAPEEKAEPEPSVPPVEPRPVEHPNPEVVPGSKLIALTFDDGPSPSTTPRLLDILNSYGVKATFFVLGQMAERNPDILVRESLEGHEVASHTPYHNQLTQLSYGVVQSEALEMDRIFKNILGRVPPFTRPPYGSYNSTVQAALAQPLILWSIDPRDWQDRNASVVCSRVVSSAFDGAVILVHDIHPTTVDAVPCIIEGLRAQGYQFLTISEMAAARDIPLLSDGVYGAF